ncbi:MAG: hypothetical protein Q7S28_04480 [bacterium]|nr:hypothetical protein [bacterium]
MTNRFINDLPRLAEKFRTSNASSSIVLPTSPFYDQFLVVRGKKEDGSGRPEPSFKNAGGGWDIEPISKFLANNGSLAELGDMTMDKETLLRLGAAAEVWEETGFLIHPHEFGEMFKLVERHIPPPRIPTKERPDSPHLKTIYGISRVFAEAPKLDNEIFDYETPPIAKVKDGVPISFDHKTAIILAHQRLRNGAGNETTVYCSVRECPYH